MKKLLLSLLSLMVVTTGAKAQVMFGPEIGGLFSNYTGKEGGSSLESKAKFGLRVGGVADISVGDNFSIQPAVMYVKNGYKASNPAASVDVSINTLEIPVNVQYKFGKPGGDRFFIGVGPYMGFNLSGHDKVTYYGATNDITIKVGNDANNDFIKPLDFGLGLNAGYLLSSNLFVRAHYQHGLVNLQPGGDANNSAFNSNYGLSVGYFFGGNTKGKKGPLRHAR